MNKRHILLALCASMLGFLAGAPGASAQCASACNVSTTHWGTLNDADRTMFIGIYQEPRLNNVWIPVYCNSSLCAWFPNPYGYATPALTTDTSLCGGALNDNLRILKPTDRVNTWIFFADGSAVAATVRGFSYNGYSFTLSGGAGNDTLSGCQVAGAKTNLCGYTGNDDLVTCNGVDYQNGGPDQDYFLASVTASGDIVRMHGDTGNDVFGQAGGSSNEIYGDSGNDCINMSGPFNVAASTCGTGTDYLVYGDSWSSGFPSSCEKYATTCCMAGYNCN